MATQFFSAPRYVPRCGVPLGLMPLNTPRFVSMQLILTDANRAACHRDPWISPVKERTRSFCAAGLYSAQTRRGVSFQAPSTFRREPGGARPAQGRERLPACKSTSRRSLAWSTASRCARRARRRPFRSPCPTQPVPTRGWAYERVSHVGVGRVHGSRRSLASARPVRVLARGAGDLLPAGDDLERLLDRGRPPFRGGGVDGGRAAAGRRVLRRLHHREEPLGGQRVRLRPDLLVLRGARALPVQGAVLGRGGGAHIARGLRARGGGAARALRLDDL